MTRTSTHERRPGLDRITDRALVARTRAGEASAYAELWRRYHGEAAGIARRATSAFDADDLVVEAYAAVLAAIRRGAGPTGDAFRAYLYATVRNLARRWASTRHEIPVEEVPEEAEGDEVLGGQLGSLDDRLVREAFASLPPRWRDVLWYTEVEGLGAAEAAPLLGITPNATAVLAFRAREGLRTAWLQAHVADTLRTGECGWVLEHIGEHSRDNLGTRAAARVDAHLATCRACRDIALEVGQVNRHLARILLPLLIGGGSVTAWLAAPSVPVAAATGLGAAAAITAIAAAVTVIAGVGGIRVSDPIVDPDDRAEEAKPVAPTALVLGLEPGPVPGPGADTTPIAAGVVLPVTPAPADRIVDALAQPVDAALEGVVDLLAAIGSEADGLLGLDVVIDPNEGSVPGVPLPAIDAQLGDGLVGARIDVGDTPSIGVDVGIDDRSGLRNLR